LSLLISGYAQPSHHQITPPAAAYSLSPLLWPHPLSELANVLLLSFSLLSLGLFPLFNHRRSRSETLCPRPFQLKGDRSLFLRCVVLIFLPVFFSFPFLSPPPSLTPARDSEMSAHCLFVYINGCPLPQHDSPPLGISPFPLAPIPCQKCSAVDHA